MAKLPPDLCKGMNIAGELQECLDESKIHDSKDHPIPKSYKDKFDAIEESFAKIRKDTNKPVNITGALKGTLWKRIRALFPKDSKEERRRTYYLFRIVSLLNAHPGLQLLLNQYATMNFFGMDPKAGKGILKDVEGETVLDYSKFPTTQMIDILSQLTFVINKGEGEGLGKGFWGKLKVQYGTTSRVGRNENSGAIHHFSNAKIDFSQRQAVHTSRFWGQGFFTPQSKEEKDTEKVYMGMESILTEISELGKHADVSFELREKIAKSSKTGEESLRPQMVDFFHRLKHGWVKWVPYDKLSPEERKKVTVPIYNNETNETDTYTLEDAFNLVYGKDPQNFLDNEGVQRVHLGAFKIAEDLLPTGKRYKSSGDPIFQFQNYVLLQDHVSESSKKPSERRYLSTIPMDKNYIELISSLSPSKNKATPSNLDKLLNEKDGMLVRMRGIFDDIHKDMTSKFEELKQEFYKLLKTDPFFKDLSDKDIKALITSPDYKEHPLWEGLPKLAKENLELLNDNFSQYIFFEPFVFGAAHPHMQVDPFGNEITENNYKQNFSPILYHPSRMQHVLWPKKIVELEEQINATLQDPNLKEKQKKIRLARLSNELARMERIKRNFKGYQTDNKGSTISLSTDTTHLKHVSNAFDLREARRDSMVDLDYLRQVYGGFERGFLQLELARTIGMSKHLDVKNYLINSYKSIMDDPTAAAGIWFLNYDMETITSVINWGFSPFKVEFTPDQIRRKLSWVASATTGLHLRGFGTAVINYSAINEGYFKQGADRMRAAQKEVEYAETSGNRDKMAAIIREAGIVSWRDYIDQGLSGKGIQYKLTTKSTKRAIAAVWRYWKEIDRANNNKGMERRAEKRLKAALGEEVALIPLHKIPTKAETKAARKEERLKWREEAANTFARYAIEKRYDKHEDVLNLPYKIWSNLFEAYTTMLQMVKLPTMGSTEERLRTVLFISAFRQLQDAEYLPKGRLWDLDSSELHKLVPLGSLYTRETAYQVGAEGLGLASSGAFGKWFNKFNFWQQQRFAADKDKLLLAFRSVRDELKREAEKPKASDTVKDMFRTINLVLNFWKYSSKWLKVNNPRAYEARNFWQFQLPFTGMMDFLILGPLSFLPFGKKLQRMLIRQIPGFRKIGGATSDLVSLMLLIGRIAWSLGYHEGDDLSWDEEMWDEIYSWYGRTAFGFGGQQIYKFILYTIAMITDSSRQERLRTGYDVAKSFLPRELAIGLEAVIDD